MVDIKEVEENGQKKLTITDNTGAEVDVYLFGATVTKFKTGSGKNLIWLSSTAKLDGTKAIRGGIPLVFPQFGQPIKEMAQHGFARNNVWTLDSKTSDGVVLTLDNTQATHDAWKHAYKLKFTIALSGETLKTSYEVENTGSEAFTFQSLQHTYLDVGDISKTSVDGLRGQAFLDKTAADPTAMQTETDLALVIDKFTDRVFVRPAYSIVTVNCPTGTLQVKGFATLSTAASVVINSDLVVWNPWEEKAKGMGDFDDEGYKRMLCIEPGLVSGFYACPAGATFGLHQELSAL